MPAIGYQWLAKAYDIVPVHPFAVQSTIGRQIPASRHAEAYSKASGLMPR